MFKFLVFISLFGNLQNIRNDKGLVWEKTYHDFGNVYEGDTAITDFRFINRSDTTVFIENVQTSCGCTVGKWPKHAIQAGDSGVIKVMFDSHGKRKTYEKVVAVYSSIGLYELTIKVNVLKH